MSESDREERVESRESICAVCKKVTATQRHHLSYGPELVIDVCVPCHIKIHQHGVGKAGGIDAIRLDNIIEERPLQLPLFTKIKQTQEIPYIVTINDEIVLTLAICPNCESLGNAWQILVNPSSSEKFLRCPRCGYDVKIEFLKRQEKPDADKNV